MRPLYVFTALVAAVTAEDGLDGWLRYAPLPDHHVKQLHSFPDTIVTINASDNGPLETAGKELQFGIEGILGRQLEIESESVSSKKKKHDGGSIIVATADAFNERGKRSSHDPSHKLKDLIEDGFYLSNKGEDVYIIGSNERGALYGAFEYLSMLAQADFREVDYVTNPDAPIRWGNQWDNLWANGTHGSVERGYGGVSIFFDGVGHVKTDLSRVPLLGRLLASVRINGLIINNVNAEPDLLSERNLDGVEKIADLLRPWGVNIGISLNFATPQSWGGLDTFDPLDDDVIDFWQGISDEMYRRIPDFAGYLVKASSEGQPGPDTYNRTLAEGANMFARTVEPYGGIVMFRAFVYNHLADWEDWYADRANAQVEFFKHLDGKFDENIIVQIKYGPIDFQVREAPSPLFANLRHTNMAIELQIAQEYLGQECHLNYLPPLWQTVLDYDLRVDGKESYVRDILSGKVFDRPTGGYTAVTNVGMNTTWLGTNMALSNLYSFGRLAWDPKLDSVDIIENWSRLTFGLNPTITDVVSDLSMKSWPTYENYTGNLGLQTLTDILNKHYGPDPASQDNNGWGQWTRANRFSIGMDRTVWNGTGNAGQYPKEIAEMYERTETTPDNLMLWFHHVPYTFRLHSGKTVIQHIYDAHYDGAEVAQTFPKIWEGVRGLIDSDRFEHEHHRLVYQAGHAIVWRDAINEFYRNLSGIPDELGRVRNHPWRIEAENMTLEGYEPIGVFPYEAASGYNAIVTNTTGTATTKVPFDSGIYNLAVNYFDLPSGNSTWEVTLNDRLVGKFKGDAEFKLGKAPSEYIDADSATRITFDKVRVRKGDTLKIKGTPDGGEQAPLDYVSFLPLGIVD